MRHRKRGIALVFAMISMIVIISFAALVIDVGVLYNTRADLQRTADAAAMAGASVYQTEDMMRVRLDTGPIDPVITEARNRTSNIGGINTTFNSNTMIINQNDIIPGWININSASEAIHTNPTPKDYNAVQVMARRDNIANGEAQLFFAAIFGKYSSGITASAVAALDDRFSGINMNTPNGVSLIPFTIHEDAFALELSNGGDQYTHDNGSVYSGPDDIVEVRLFPYPLSGSGEEGDGNFGFLNIGNNSQSADVERDQIADGITEDQIVDEFGTSQLIFYDDTGEPITYTVGGSPGLEATMENTIEERIGDLVGFFLHDDYQMSGANITYRITRLAYGIIMDVKLTGNLDSKYLYIQPHTYVGGDVIIDEDAPSSEGMIGRIVLVR